MTTANPYSAPQAPVADQTDNDFYQPKVFSFSGRIGRLRYLAYNVAWNLAAMGIAFAIGLLSAIFAVISETLAVVGLIGMGLAYIISIVAGFAMAVRRLNDMNSSGWLSLLMLVPFVNFIFALVLIFAPGTKATNNYGPQPPENTAAVYIGALILPFGGIAIIGILAAIALPAYQDYTLRAQVSEAMMQVEPVKGKVENYVRQNQEFPVQNQDIDHSWRNSSPYVQSIDVATGGVITLVVESENTSTKGKTIVFRPTTDNGYVEWDCTGGDLDTRFRPSICRAM